MRISSTQINDTMLGSLQTNYSQYGRLQMQIASNKKLLQPSDDPIASVALLGLKKEQASLNQYQKNITQVQNQLSQSEVQLESMTTMMLRLQDLTQTAANDSYSDADRAGIAVEIRSLQEGLIDLANAQDENGSYLFSGSLVDQAPVVKDASGYHFQGDTYERQVTVAHGVMITANDNAQALFFASGNFFQQLDDFATQLEAGGSTVNAQATTMLEQIQSTQDNISLVRSGIGARGNTLTQLDTSHDEMRVFSQQVSNELEALDYSEATTQMSETLMALQVTMQSFSKVNSLSLFNYL